MKMTIFFVVLSLMISGCALQDECESGKCGKSSDLECSSDKCKSEKCDVEECKNQPEEPGCEKLSDCTIDSICLRGECLSFNAICGDNTCECNYEQSLALECPVCPSYPDISFELECPDCICEQECPVYEQNCPECPDCECNQCQEQGCRDKCKKPKKWRPCR